MDKITEQLLAIESEAQQAMNAMAKENTRLARKAGEDLQRRVALLEDEGAETAKRLGREADEAAAARIAQLQEEYRRKTEALEEEFRAGKEALRKKILNDILYGEP